MTPRGRTLTEWSLLGILLVGLVGLAAWQGWLWRVDRLLYDAGLPLLSRQAPADIVIVAIDEPSLARIGRWPWRRAVHATLLHKLAQAGATVVGIDIILNEPDTDDTNGEALLVEAIARHGRVVLPVIPPPLGAPQFGEGRPTTAFASVSAALGHIEMPIDADGIIRGLYLWGGSDAAMYPQFALAMLSLADPARAARYRSAATSDNSPAPDTWRHDVWHYLRYAGPPGTFRTVSYVDVLTGAVGMDQLRGTLVLVGATAAGLGDLHATPMSASGQPMAGVEIHANVLDSLRTGNTVAWMDRPTTSVISAMVILLLLVGLLHLSPRAGLVLSTGVGLVTTVVGVVQLRWGQPWLPPSAILLGAALAYPLWSWRRLEATQRFMDDELRRLRDSDPTPAAERAEHGLDPLDRRIAIIRSAADRQRLAQKAREDLVRFISHDIRSVLVSIITLIEGAAGRNDPARGLQRIGRYAQHALDMADDFSRLKKAETVDPRTFREVDLAALAQEAADEVWPQAEAKRIVIVIDIDDAGGQDALVLGDESLLRRTLTNLLGNAVKYSPPDTTVRVVLTEDGRWREIAVVDEGYGIPADQMDRLFTRHARVSRPGQPDQPGIGLGLVIVKTIVDRHGGGVSVESAPGIGSTFRVRLPRAPFRHA